MRVFALALCGLVLPVLAVARPLDVRVHVRARLAAHAGAVLVHEGLLTPSQLACMDLVPERHGSARVAHVALFQRHGGFCPGPLQPPTYLTDVYVDTISGVVDATPEMRDELVTQLPGEPILR